MTGARSDRRNRRPSGWTSSRSSAGSLRGRSTTSSPRVSRWSIAFGPVAGPQHPPPLRPPRERQLAPLDDAARPAHEQLVRASVAGGDQVGVEVGQDALERRQPVARGERERGGRAGAPLELEEPAGRRLLEHRDIPVAALEPTGELVEQRAVHLHVGLVALGDPEQARAQGEERLIGWEVAAVVEIPAEDSHWQGTS